MKKSSNSHLDVSRLTRDVEALSAEKEATEGSRDGRVKSGAMKVVRENLTQIRALHDAGHIWDTIAKALAAQGLTQGEGDPITGRRLSSLVCAADKQAAHWEQKSSARSNRRDLVQPARRSSLSPDLSPLSRPEPSPSGSPSEDQLRRDRLIAVEGLFAPPAEPKFERE